MICVTCNISCLTCKGPAPTDCLICKKDLYKNLDSSCKTNCTLSYGNNTTFICE